ASFGFPSQSGLSARPLSLGRALAVERLPAAGALARAAKPTAFPGKTPADEGALLLLPSSPLPRLCAFQSIAFPNLSDAFAKALERLSFGIPAASIHFRGPFHAGLIPGGHSGVQFLWLGAAPAIYGAPQRAWFLVLSVMLRPDPPHRARYFRLHRKRLFYR